MNEIDPGYEMFLKAVALTQAMANLPFRLRKIYLALVEKDYPQVDREVKYGLPVGFDYPDWLQAYLNASSKEMGRDMAVEVFIGKVLTEE